MPEGVNCTQSCTQVRFVSDTLARSEGGHGPEQQLIHALVKCLSQSMSEFPVGDRRLMTSFEELLLTEQNCGWSGADVCCILGMSDRLIRQCCQACVDMRPQSILRQLHERLGGGTAAWLPPPESPRSCLSNTVRRVAVAYPVTVSLWRASAIVGVTSDLRQKPGAGYPHVGICARVGGEAGAMPSHESVQPIGPVTKK